MEKSEMVGGGGREERGERVGAQVTARDLAALGWLAEVRAATITQLTELLGRLGDGPITDRRGAQLIARWEALGLIEKHNYFHQEPACVTLTTDGARLVGRSRWRRPALGTMRHTLSATQVRLQVERPGSINRWVTEAQLRAELPAGTRIPDGAIVPADGTPGATAVEIELSRKGRPAVKENIVSVLSCLDGSRPRFDKVLYLVSDATKVQVEAVRAELPEPLRSRVVVLPCPA